MRDNYQGKWCWFVSWPGLPGSEVANTFGCVTSCESRMARLSIGIGPHLNKLVPSTTDNDGVLWVRAETNA
jgi:hypothetical protein